MMQKRQIDRPIILQSSEGVLLLFCDLVMLLEDKRVIFSAQTNHCLNAHAHALKLTLSKGASFVALLHLRSSCTKDKGKKPEEPEKPKPDHYSVSWFNSPSIPTGPPPQL